MLITKKITINCPIKEAYNYLLDFSQIYEWDENVEEAQRQDLGKIQVGSKFNLIYSIWGKKFKLQYELIDLSEKSYLHFQSLSNNFCSDDKIIFEDLGEKKTRITYKAKITLKNKLSHFLLEIFMKKSGEKIIKKIKTCLEKKESNYNKDRSLNLVNLSYRFSKKGWNKRKKSFTMLPSIKKKILITGPTSGIGKSAAYTLAGKNCDLILIARNEEKLESLKNDLKQKNFSQELSSYVCDINDLKKLKKVCQKIEADGHKIDVLINNAGALYNEEKLIDGVERTTITHVFAPWFLSLNLLGQMNKKSCIINVSSGGMYASKLSLKELKKSKSPFSGSKSYSQAKRAMEIVSSGLNSELKNNDIRVHTMHPGWADTPGVLSSLPGFYKVTKRFLRTPFQGADTLVWLALSNPKDGGEFWLDRQIQKKHLFDSTLNSKGSYLKLKNFIESHILNLEK